MTRTLVVYCHPLGRLATSPRSVIACSPDWRRPARRFACTDLYADGFDPRSRAADHRRHMRARDRSVARPLRRRPPVVRDARARLPHVVGGPAGDAQGMDRSGLGERGGVDPAGRSRHRLRPQLRNIRRLVAVTTHGSPKYVNAIEGEGGKRTMTRSLRLMCHPLARTTWLALYGVDNAVRGSAGSRSSIASNAASPAWRNGSCQAPSVTSPRRPRRRRRRCSRPARGWSARCDPRSPRRSCRARTA